MTENNVGPLTYLHETVAYQLKNAVEEISNGDGLVADFDYDEEVERDYLTSNEPTPIAQERIVTLELTYILPE